MYSGMPFFYSFQLPLQMLLKDKLSSVMGIQLTWCFSRTCIILLITSFFFSLDVSLGQHCSDMAFSSSFLSVRSDTSQDISVSVLTLRGRN